MNPLIRQACRTAEMVNGLGVHRQDLKLAGQKHQTQNGKLLAVKVDSNVAATSGCRGQRAVLCCSLGKFASVETFCDM